MKVNSAASDAYIIFFPYKQEVTLQGKDFDESFLETKHFFVRNELMSVSTSKPKSGQGSWSCSISSNKNYKKLIQPGCWCLIYMSDENLAQASSDKERGLKMFGMVKSVRRVESTDSNTGARSVRYDISGVDFHKALENKVYINRIAVVTGTKETKPLIDAALLFQNFQTRVFSPDEAVKSIIEAVLGKSRAINSPLSNAGITVGDAFAIPSPVSTALIGEAAKDNKFINAMNLILQKGLVGKLFLQPDIGDSYSCWSLVQAYSHGILNEVYSDLLPDPNGVLRPSVVLRAIPFNKPKGKGTGAFADGTEDTTFKVNRLNDGMQPWSPSDTKEGGIALYISKEIDEGDIIQLNYGKSDSERFNFFFVLSNSAIDYGMDGAKLVELTGSASVKTLVDSNSMVRYGLRDFRPTSAYLTLSDDHIKQVNVIARDLWHRAHMYENGQVTIHGSKTHIPVGTNIAFTDRGWVAHVEQVDHSFSVSPSGVKTYRTTLSFIRLRLKDTHQPIDLNDTSNDHDWDRGVTHSLGIGKNEPNGDHNE